MKSIKLGALAALALGTVSATALQAQDSVTLKFAHVFPAGHWLWTEAGEVFANEVEEKSDGRITFQVFPAAQLGKETANIVSSGLAESGVVVPSYEAAKVPLSSVLELPGLHSTACEGTAKFWSLAQEGGALFENEYKQLGLRPLYVNVLTPYQLMTNTKKVTSLEDVAGLKARANGPAMDKTIRALGGVGVRVTSSEAYDSLARGTVDGALWPIGSTYQIGLEKVLNYTVQPTQLGGGSTFYVIRESVWQDLSEEDQQILLDAGQAAQQHLCSYLDKLDADVTEQMVSEGELEIVTLSDEEAARWAEALSGVGDDWVAEIESTGRPGREVLDAYRAAPAQF